MDMLHKHGPKFLLVVIALALTVGGWYLKRELKPSLATPNEAFNVDTYIATHPNRVECPFTHLSDFTYVENLYGDDPRYPNSGRLIPVLPAGSYYDCYNPPPGEDPNYVWPAQNIVLNEAVIFGTDPESGRFVEILFKNLSLTNLGRISSAYGCRGGDWDSRDGSGPDASNVCKTLAEGGRGAGQHGLSDSGSGGGYGGVGGWAPATDFGGKTFGSAVNPLSFGAGGATSSRERSEIYPLSDPGIGGAGGGIVHLRVAGDFSSYGTISANGKNGVVGLHDSGDGAGGGSGGSVNILVNGEFIGSPIAISAKGGNGRDNFGSGGGGGGGRISIVYGSGSIPLSAATFDVSNGTSGHNRNAFPEKGTVYVKNLDTNRVNIYHGFTYGESSDVVAAWNVDPSATNQYCVDGISDVTVTAGSVNLSGQLDCVTQAEGSSLRFNSVGPVVMDGFVYTGTPKAYLKVDGGGSVDVKNTSIIKGNLRWDGIGNISLDSTSSLIADSMGCTEARTGPTTNNLCRTSVLGGMGTVNDSTWNGGAGGGHGGVGGNAVAGPTPGAAYDSSVAPVLFGAAGGTTSLYPESEVGNGGGVIIIRSSGTGDIAGTVSANGENGSVIQEGHTTGGGAGGSIQLVMAGRLSGHPAALQANGGVGANLNGRAGGGGGGRIAIEYGGSSTESCLPDQPGTPDCYFSGEQFSVLGGTISYDPYSQSGQRGTVYTKNTEKNWVKIFQGFEYDGASFVVSRWTTDPSAVRQTCQPGTNTQITTVDATFGGVVKCDQYGTGTSLSLNASGLVKFDGLDYTGAPQGFFNIAGGAAVTLANSSIIKSNVKWDMIRDLEMDATSKIQADGKGCTVPGTGPTDDNVCLSGNGRGGGLSDGYGGGGAHGGEGGRGQYSGAPGRPVYDSVEAPVLFGSAGGKAILNPNQTNGYGGGVVRINVAGNLNASSGSVTADGYNWPSSQGHNQSAGGGAGGSIYLSATGAVCVNNSALHANGSRSQINDTTGGGGGGGRVSLTYGVGTLCADSLANLTAAQVAAPGCSGDCLAYNDPNVGNAQYRIYGGPGSVGSYYQALVAPIVPTLVSFTHSPLTPTSNDDVTITGVAEHATAVSKIELYLDGTEPAQLKKTCAEEAPSLSCDVNLGKLSEGNHTVYMRAYHNAQYAEFSHPIVVTAPIPKPEIISVDSTPATKYSTTLVTLAATAKTFLNGNASIKIYTQPLADALTWDENTPKKTCSSSEVTAGLDFACSMVPSLYEVGTYVMRAVVIDAAGLESDPVMGSFTVLGGPLGSGISQTFTRPANAENVETVLEWQGAKITLPPGAWTADMPEITMTPTNMPPPGVHLRHWDSWVWKLEPEGRTFNPPVTIELPVQRIDVGTTYLVCTNSSTTFTSCFPAHTTLSQTVYITRDHFSYWYVTSVPAGSPLITEVGTNPSPVLSTSSVSLKAKGLAKVDGALTMQVYSRLASETGSGALVKTCTFPDAAADVEYECSSSPQSLAAGDYVMTVKITDALDQSYETGLDFSVFTPPSASVVLNPASNILTTAPLTVTGSRADAGSVQSVLVEVDSASLGYHAEQTCISSPCDLVIPADTLDAAQDYVGKVTVTDTNGITGVDTKTFSVFAPLIVTGSWTPESVARDIQVTLHGDAAYSLGVSKIELRLDAATKPTKTCTFSTPKLTASCDYGAVVLAPGAHTLKAMVYGSDASTLEDVKTFTVGPVSGAPGVSILAKTASGNFSVGDSVVLYATSTDDVAVKSLEIYLDDATPSSPTGTPRKICPLPPAVGKGKTLACSLTVGKLTLGAHTISARAFDEESSATYTTNITVTNGLPVFVPATRPLLNFENPTDANSMIITYKAKDDLAVRKLEIYVNDVLKKSYPIEPKVGTASTLQLSYAAGKLLSGDYSVKAVAYDAVGSTTSDVTAFRVTNQAPVATGSASVVREKVVTQVDQTNTATAFETVSVKGTGTDGNGVMRVDVYLDPAPGALAGQTPVKSCVYTGTPVYTRTCSTSALARSIGTHVVGVRVQDNEGVWSEDNSAARTFNVTLPASKVVNISMVPNTTTTVLKAVTLGFPAATVQPNYSGSVTFDLAPSGLTLNSVTPAGSGACLSNVVQSGNSITATATNCTGNVTLKGLNLTAPDEPAGSTVAKNWPAVFTLNP